MSYSTAMERLSQMRKKAGLTLREMGDKTNISPTRINRFEKGERIGSVEELASIFDALNLSEEKRRELLKEMQKE